MGVYGSNSKKKKKIIKRPGATNFFNVSKGTTKTATGGLTGLFQKRGDFK